MLLPRFVLLVLLVAGLTGLARGHEGDPHAQRLLAAAYAERLPVGDPRAVEAIRAVAVRAANVRGEAGQPLLPAGTSVEDVRWRDALLEIHLTLPADQPTTAGTRWRLSPLDMETLSRALAAPFLDDPAFSGVRTRVRSGPDQPYGSLEQFVPRSPPPRPHGPNADQENAAALRPQPPQPPADPTFGGPTAQGARQPLGALTGVTVFVSAGHGWTANASWVLQRPLLFSMNEDYGNLDVLNYFVHFAFNAGATVVPLRPTGWQPIEIVLDNDDPGVSYTGAWGDSANPKYYENGVTLSGVSYRFATAAVTESATARFTPTIAVTDFYPVYGYAVTSTNRVRQTYRIRHSGGTSAVTVDHRLAGNGWVWLGDYFFAAGGEAWVEVTNASPDVGVVIADAVRWGGGTGDILRPGPGAISGYPRDEEAQRYWAESEFGNNAVGYDSGIWDVPGSSDLSDNVGAGARMAREMNLEPAGGVLVDRWKRIHLEFHSNASTGTARGQICLITDTGPTTNQVQYATTLSNEVDADLTLLSGEFEHAWFDRSAPTFTSSYGAISTSNNSNEFDATIVELAFHDNQQDAELLRDPRVRRAMARACVHGIIRFLNSLPGSQVPLAFPPDTPRDVRVEDLGNGDVRVAWQTPLVDGARGDAATGYVVYQSSNGYGFGAPVVLGNVSSTVISGLAPGETRYFRVAATNVGGESMPSEVLAVRRPSSGTANVLIVNGFDRLRRQINPIQTFAQPPAYAGQSIERQIWRQANAFDYTVEHAEALAANDVGFASCSNEAVIDSLVQLGDYDIVVWILGTESNQDRTFTVSEQNRVTTFLNDGGGLFVSGADLAYDLINQGGGVSFAQNTLRIGFSAHDAGTFDVTPTAGGILDGVGSFDFDPAAGAAYEVREPDVLLAGTGAQACLNYIGGTGGIAGVQFAGPVYHVVAFGFPFETISAATVRAAAVGRVIEFLAASPGPIPFDFDNDGDVDNDDFAVFLFCFQGPDGTYPDGHLCREMDGDGDQDVDMADFRLFQATFTGPGP